MLVFITSLFSQQIEDRGAPRHLEDIIQYEGQALQLRFNSTCTWGSLVPGTVPQEPFIHGWAFLRKGKLQTIDDQWTSLTINRDFDDSSQEFNVFTSGDLSNSDEIRWEEFIEFKDYTVRKLPNGELNLIIIEEEFRRLFIYTKEGQFIREIFNFLTPIEVDFKNDFLYVFEERGIHIMNDDDELTKSIFLDTSIQSIEWDDKRLIVATTSEIQIFNKDLELIEQIALASTKPLKDLCTFNNKMYFLHADDDGTAVFEIDETGTTREVFANENFRLKYNAIVPDNNRIFIFGQQEVEGPENQIYTSIIQQNIEEQRIAQNSISINLNAIEEIPDTFAIQVDAQGNEFPEIHYSYKFSLEVVNTSDEVIRDFLIVSNRQPGVNCSYAHIVKKYNEYTIQPNASIFIDSTFNAIRKFDEFCFYALAVNGQIDQDFSDNSTCEILSSSQDPLVLSDIKIYPNPVQELLYIESEYEIKNIQIYDVHGGKALDAYATILGQNQIDVSALSAGLYFINVSSGEGTGTTRKFLKQ